MRESPVVLCSDWDGTLCGDDETLHILARWLSVRQDFVSLVIATGRVPESILYELQQWPDLPRPRYIIADVGTTVLDGSGEPIVPLNEEIAAEWPGRDVIRDTLAGLTELTEQPISTPRRMSYFLTDDLRLSRIREQVEPLGCVAIRSGEQYLDILPRSATKGRTLQRLVAHLGWDGGRVRVAGDSLNDLSLFEAGFRGVVVRNAEQTLRDRAAVLPNAYFARQAYAAGIHEFLRQHSGELTLTHRTIWLVSHREPYTRKTKGGQEVLERKTNGVFAALDPVLRQNGGTWVCWSLWENGHYASADAMPRLVTVPDSDASDVPAYSCLRIPLSNAEVEDFYHGFTTQALWPVLFCFLERCDFQQSQWETYTEINQRFAELVAEEAPPSTAIWINDFHLCLVPRYLRGLRPDLNLALFLHTAFPPPDVFGVLPWREEILEGMLHCELIGFHIPSYQRNFADSCERFLDASASEWRTCDFPVERTAVSSRIAPHEVRYRGRSVRLGSFPVGADTPALIRTSRRTETVELAANIREQTGTEAIILACERLDYVKGPLERLRAFETFLEQHPRFRGAISYLQIAVPTRQTVEDFEVMRAAVDEAVGRINGRFSTISWLPVHHFYRALQLDELIAYYMAADIIWVTALRDGMNLIPKEYVSIREDLSGAVILSEFAGVAADLPGAFLVNPNDPEDMVRVLHEVLSSRSGNLHSRMHAMRMRCLRRNVHWWSREFVESAFGAHVQDR